MSGAARIIAIARTEKAPKPVCDPHRGVGSGSRRKAVALPLSASGLMDDMSPDFSREREKEVMEKDKKRHGGEDGLIKAEQRY